MDWFSIFFDILSLMILCISHIRFVVRLSGKSPKIWNFGVYFSLLCILQTTAVIFEFSFLCSIGAEILALYSICRILLKNSRPVACAGSVLAIYISQLSFGMINSLEVMLIPSSLRGWLLYLIVVLAVAASAGICIGVSNLVLRFLSLDEEEFKPYLQILMISGLFFLAVQCYILETAYSSLPPKMEIRKQMALLILQTLGLGALLCTLYAYGRACDEMRARNSFHSLTQAIHGQKIYVQQAQLRYEKTQAFRHDIRNHLTVLKGLLDTGQTEAARAYLQKLDAKSSLLSFPVYTGRPAADILLGEKLELAKEKGIKTHISLAVPNSFGIDEFDLCVVLANGLDNAIHACQTVPGNPWIGIFGETQGDFFRIQLENTCKPGPLPPMGTGLSNIRAVAEKYQGTMMFEKEEGVFRLNVLLNTYHS